VSEFRDMFDSDKTTTTNNIYFAKWQVNQKGKSPSKLATILEKKKKLRYKHLGKPVSKTRMIGLPCGEKKL